MKFALALAALLVAGAQGFRISENEGVLLSGNFVDQLLQKGLEYARTLLEENEPLSLPDLDEQTLVDDDVNMVIQLSSVKLSNASNFVVNKISTNLNNLTATFELTLPSLHLEGKHTVNGTAFENDVVGDGTFSVNLTNFVQDGQVQFTVEDKSLQIKSLDLQYTLNSAEFDIVGIEATTMTNEKIVEYLNTELLTTLNDHQDFVCEKVANHVISIVNSLMEGKSLAQVLKWLKNAIN